MRLLLVEDNDDLSGLVSAQLRGAGYEVDALRTVSDARASLRLHDYSAMVLDRGLPDEDGITLLRELRARKDLLPTVVLTAHAAVGDRVHGLRAGADDYLAKPFEMDELLARIEAVLRRHNRPTENMLHVANLSLDLSLRQLTVGSHSETLSPREFDVLELLCRRKGRVVPKRALEDHLFGITGELGSNAVEVYVHRVRKRLAEVGALAQVHTIRGVGYMIGEG